MGEAKIFLNHTDVVNADYAGAFICKALWNQYLALYDRAQLIFLGWNQHLNPLRLTTYN